MIQFSSNSKTEITHGKSLVGVFFCHEIDQLDNPLKRSLEAVVLTGSKSIAEIAQDIPIIFNKQSIYIGACLESDRIQLKDDRKQLVRTHRNQSYQSIINHIQHAITKTTSDTQQLVVEAMLSQSQN